MFTYRKIVYKEDFRIFGKYEHLNLFYSTPRPPLSGTLATHPSSSGPSISSGISHEIWIWWLAFAVTVEPSSYKYVVLDTVID